MDGLGRVSKRLFWVTVFLACLSTVLGYLGGWCWVMDLFAHFRMEYLIVQMIGCALLGVARRPRWSLAVLLFALLNAREIIPFFLPTPQQHWVKHHEEVLRNNGLPRLRVLQSNVLFTNTETQWIQLYLRQTQPDVAAFVEALNHWGPALLENPALRRQYPYYFHAADLLVMSRQPLRVIQPPSVQVGDPEHYFMVVETTSPDHRPVRLLVMHTGIPLTSRNAASLRRVFGLIAEKTPEWTAGGVPLVVVGDYNATPWSTFYQILLRSKHLYDGRTGFGPQPTWPAMLPLLYIPIDNTLMSRNLVMLSRRVGPYVGSDHFPVLNDIGFMPTGWQDVRSPGPTQLFNKP